MHNGQAVDLARRTDGAPLDYPKRQPFQPRDREGRFLREEMFQVQPKGLGVSIALAVPTAVAIAVYGIGLFIGWW